MCLAALGTSRLTGSVKAELATYEDSSERKLAMAGGDSVIYAFYLYLTSPDRSAGVLQ
jgi:hypothetical protein